MMAAAKSKWSGAYWKDLLERVAATVVAVLIPMVVAAQTTPISDALSIKIVISAAILTALKGLGANLVNPDSGASLTAAVQVRAPAGPTVPPPGLDATGDGPYQR